MNEAYDIYAAAALQALIAKMPFIDREAELGVGKTQAEINEIKNEITRSAHAYAFYMIQNRQEFIDSLNK